MKYKDEEIKKAAENLVESLDQYLSDEWLNNENYDEADFQESASKKQEDDYHFDDSFNEAIRNKYYEAHYLSAGSFYLFQEHLNSLYTYYQYLKRFMNYYSKQAMEYYEKQRVIAEKASEMSVMFDFWDYTEEIDLTEEVNRIQYENILMSLYVVFERFLKQFIQENDSCAEVLNNPQGDHTVLDYMYYLHREKGIFVPRSLFREYNIIRMVRNYFVHSSDKVSDKLKSFLANDTTDILRNERIILNEEFIDNAFESIGSIVKCIEEFVANQSTAS